MNLELILALMETQTLSHEVEAIHYGMLCSKAAA